MNVTILGATGSMGREITSQLIRSRALSRHEILQLATNPYSGSASRLCAEGIRRDLQDAYAEINPEIQVVTDPSDFVGDIVVVAAGRTIQPGEIQRSRQDLEQEAGKICRQYAAQLAQSLISNQITPILLIVTNPVEYVVQYFAQELSTRIEGGARFVIGMGAHSDSLRFQWELAHDLGIARERISAEVVSEHGPLMVPRWSTVQIRGMPEREQERALARLFARDKEALKTDFDELLARRRDAVLGALIRKNGKGDNTAAGDVFRLLEQFRPDFRVILKPLLVHHTNSKTAHATGVAATTLIQAILRGDRLTPTVQRMVSVPRGSGDELFPFGVPTPLDELFRLTAPKAATDWEWRDRSYPAGSFRAERASAEAARIDSAISALHLRSCKWREEHLAA